MLFIIVRPPTGYRLIGILTQDCTLSQIYARVVMQ